MIATDYKIVERGSIHELQEAVSTEILAGWQPVGGITVTQFFPLNPALPRYTDQSKGFAQAMVRDYRVATAARVVLDEIESR